MVRRRTKVDMTVFMERIVEIFREKAHQKISMPSRRKCDNISNLLDWGPSKENIAIDYE
jgi:hypothetical protein